MSGQKTKNITIVIADDHAVVREGIKSLLDRQPDMQVLAEASNGAQAVELFTTHRPDITILDASMPGKSGLEVLHELRQLDAQAKILIFSMYPEEQFALPYLRAGASGYLEKTQDVNTLVLAIRQVASGKMYVSQNMAVMLADHLSDPESRPPHTDLSSREYQILLHLASGKTLTATAGEMSLSSRTISTYRKRIFEKMRLRNTSELISYAVRHRLLG